MASSLNHPHILTVHDMGELDGTLPSLVTEWSTAARFREWADADRRTWPQIVELLVGVADGLALHIPQGLCTGTSSPRTFWSRKMITKTG